MDLAATRSVELSGFDLMLLRAGLKTYLQAFATHREEAGGASHPDDEWRILQRQIGQLIWRLEEAGAPAGAAMIHSEEAVDPASRPSFVDFRRWGHLSGRCHLAPTS